MLSVICFGVGTIIGGCIGFVVCALCIANKGEKNVIKRREEIVN